VGAAHPGIPPARPPLATRQSGLGRLAAEPRAPNAPATTHSSGRARIADPATGSSEDYAISPAEIASASTRSGSAPSSTRRSTFVVSTTTRNATATDTPAKTYAALGE
jgi:hypothetical protein